MPIWLGFLVVFLGSGVGGMLRHGVGFWAALGDFSTFDPRLAGEQTCIAGPGFSAFPAADEHILGLHHRFKLGAQAAFALDV